MWRVMYDCIVGSRRSEVVVRELFVLQMFSAANFQKRLTSRPSLKLWVHVRT